MQRNQPKLGQIGEYWLSKKPGRTGARDPWCRTWYDPRKRQTCRVSVGTADFQEATHRLAKWVVDNRRPINERPETSLIDRILVSYWNNHATFSASAKTEKYLLALWQEYWEGKAVSEITPHSQRDFVKWLRSRGIKSSTVDRVLSAGRAALNFAADAGELVAVPHISLVETSAEREARPPLGRPLSVPEMARFIDAIAEPHLIIFCVILANTLARSSAILELRSSQYDRQSEILQLNPEGRLQTKKRRPTLLVSSTLAKWLDFLNSSDYFVSYENRAIKSIRSSWAKAVKAAKLEGKVNRYSFRHGMARALRERGVNLEDLGAVLGHKHTGAKSVTAIYAPDSPAQMRKTISAIEGIMTEIKARLTRIDLDNPGKTLEALSERRPRGNGRTLSASKRQELDRLILSGDPTREIADKMQVSYTAIYKRRKVLSA